MRNSYSVISDKESINTLTINIRESVKIGVIASKKQRVKFGQEVHEMRIITSEKLAANEIMISTKNDFTNLPLSANYELKMKNNELIIGPFIGILCARSNKNIERRLISAKCYVKYYSNISGAIIVFSLDDMNEEEKTITGYLYNPRKNKFEEGTFKFPVSIYRTADIKKKWRQFFEKEFNNNFFNSQGLDKWSTYKILNKCKKVRAYLPQTVKYRQPEDVEYFLNHFNAVYLKPINGHLGLGIIKISKENHGYLIKCRYKLEESSEFYNKIEDVHKYLTQKIKKRKYILQQPLDIRINERVIDFRVYMNKNQTGCWKVYGIYGKKGADGNITSNLYSGGKVTSAKKRLKLDYRMSDIEVEKYYAKMRNLSLAVGQALDKSGLNMGRTGLDIAIDRDKKMWFIEANCFPTYRSVKLISGKEAYYKLRESNMLYAKYLAGFPASRTYWDKPT